MTSMPMTRIVFSLKLSNNPNFNYLEFFHFFSAASLNKSLCHECKAMPIGVRFDGNKQFSVRSYALPKKSNIVDNRCLIQFQP